jgi:hypothetical protein
MTRPLPLVSILLCLIASLSFAEDFNVVAYTGHYNSSYPQGTIADLAPIPIGPDGWPRLSRECLGGLCPAEEIEIFLFVSADGTAGIAGLDFADTTTTDEFGNPRPSGIFSGDWDDPDPYVTIQNRARWQGGPHSGDWIPIHDETDANYWNSYYGYDTAADSWTFEPFTYYLTPIQEDPSPPPGNEYSGDFYKGAALQFDPDVGIPFPELGSNGQLVPFLHLVIERAEMPYGALTWVSVAGLPALVDTQRPDDYNWLGVHVDDQSQPPEILFVPYGRIEFYCIPEPATCALLLMMGLPAIIRRRS